MGQGVKGSAARRGCAVTDCPRPHLARGWCSLHLQRARRTGDPLKVRAPHRYQPRTENLAWVGDAATYTTVHSRLRAQLGPASGYCCHDCDGPAREWSLIHGHETERVCPSNGRAFALDLAAYVPRCASCHRVYDLDHDRQLQRGRYRHRPAAEHAGQ